MTLEGCQNQEEGILLERKEAQEVERRATRHNHQPRFSWEKMVENEEEKLGNV